MATAADDTLRKPLSRLLCLTVTVMQTSMHTHTHAITHTRIHTYKCLDKSATHTVRLV